MPVTITRLTPDVLLLRQGPQHVNIGDPYDTIVVLLEKDGHIELHGMVGKPDIKEITRALKGRRVKYWRYPCRKRRLKNIQLKQ